AQAAPAPERLEERPEALDRAALGREAQGLEALADSARARASDEAATWRGPRAKAIASEVKAAFERRQAESARLAALATSAQEEARTDAPLAQRRDEAASARRAAIDAWSA